MEALTDLFLPLKILNNFALPFHKLHLTCHLEFGDLSAIVDSVKVQGLKVTKVTILRLLNNNNIKFEENIIDLNVATYILQSRALHFSKGQLKKIEYQMRNRENSRTSRYLKDDRGAMCTLSDVIP